MDLTIAIVLAAAALLLLLAPISFAYIRLRRRHTISDDIERSIQTAKIAHSPDTTTTTTTKSITIRRFSWPEIESLTNNFSPAAVIGQGGFCTVYLAHLPSSSPAAIKVHRSSERLHRAFRLELDALLHLRHPHIVRLLGYCDSNPEEGALVLEHAPNGTLYDRLHVSDCNCQPLTWRQRTSIAVKLSTAMEYLHEHDPQVVHGDIKSANVLLDIGMDPKLCDFGSIRMGFSAAVAAAAGKTAMTGSPGYVDPHYFRTGMVSKKSDVYSFGVLLLELVTGEEAYCSESERPLTERMRRGEVAAVDARLRGEYDAAEAAAVAETAARCVGENPSLRPSMAEVVKVFERMEV